MTEKELRQRCSSAEFVDWMAFMEIEAQDRLMAVHDTKGGVQAVVVIDSIEG